MVISQEIIERAMEYRGSKSNIEGPSSLVFVKEQRVYGSWYGVKAMADYSHLRCTLMGSERNYQTRIPSKYINTHRCFFSALTQPSLTTTVILVFLLVSFGAQDFLLK
jgi:hypothetical protein